MNNTTTTNAVIIPSTMIVMTTPVITYMEPDPLSILASLLRLDNGPLMIFVALVTSTDSEAS